MIQIYSSGSLGAREGERIIVTPGVVLQHLGLLAMATLETDYSIGN